MVFRARGLPHSELTRATRATLPSPACLSNSRASPLQPEGMPPTEGTEEYSTALEPVTANATRAQRIPATSEPRWVGTRPMSLVRIPLNFGPFDGVTVPVRGLVRFVWPPILGAEVARAGLLVRSVFNEGAVFHDGVGGSAEPRVVAAKLPKRGCGISWLPQGGPPQNQHPGTSNP